MAADKTSLNITYTDPNGKKTTKAITDVDGNAGDANLRVFCENLVKLTDNTLNSVEKIERTALTADRDRYGVEEYYNYSVCPTAFGVDWFEGHDELAVKLNYKGNDRTPTISGKKWTNSTITVEPRQIIIKKNAGVTINYGHSEAVMFIVIPADNSDASAQATGPFTLAFSLSWLPDDEIEDIA